MTELSNVDHTTPSAREGEQTQTVATNSTNAQYEVPANVETPKPDFKYTDADLDKYKGTARQEGRQSGLNEQLARFEGAQSWADIEAAWLEKQELEQAAQSEQDRLQQERDAARAELKKTRELANRRLVDSKLERALIGAGIPAERLGDALRLVDRSGIQVENEQVSGVDELATQLVESKPWLLPTQEQQRSVAPDATPQTPPKLDVSAMSEEEFQKFTQDVINGRQIPPPV